MDALLLKVNVLLVEPKPQPLETAVPDGDQAVAQPEPEFQPVPVAMPVPFHPKPVHETPEGGVGPVAGVSPVPDTQPEAFHPVPDTEIREAEVSAVPTRVTVVAFCVWVPVGFVRAAVESEMLTEPEPVAVAMPLALELFPETDTLKADAVATMDHSYAVPAKAEPEVAAAKPVKVKTSPLLALPVQAAPSAPATTVKAEIVSLAPVHAAPTA